MITLNDKNKQNVWRAFWVVSFLVQFALFRTYYLRELADYIPTNMDQVGYMLRTYTMYDLILEGKILECVKCALSVCVNSGMLMVGVINLFIVGETRFALLLPNFLGFFVMQIAGAFSIKRISNNRWLALAYCGLVWMTQAAFAEVGGMFDYRWDFLALCTYTVWIILLVEYFVTDNRKIFWYSAISCGVMLFVRLNLILYVVGTIFCVFIIQIICKRKEWLNYICDWLKYIGVVIISGGWFLIINFKNFFSYYFSALFTSPTGEAWKEHMPLKENIVYYPQILYKALMGNNQINIIVIFVCVLLVVLICLRKKIKCSKNKIIAWSVLLFSWLVPYAILTKMENKNSAAAMILISPLILLPVLMAAAVPVKTRICQWIVGICSVVIGLTGVCDLLGNMTQNSPYYSKYELEDYTTANAVIVEHMDENRIESAEIIFDRLLGNFFAETVEVYSKEFKKNTIDISYAIPAMKSDYVMAQFDETELQVGLENANYIVVNEDGYQMDSSYTADQMLDKYRSEIVAYAKNSMILLDEVNVDGMKLSIYAKPFVTINTQWTDWLGVNNTEIVVTDVTNKNCELVLEGNYNYYYDGLEVTAECDGKELSVVLETSEETNRYCLHINLANVVENETLKIKIRFNQSFVPSKEMGSADERELVICYPEKVYLKSLEDTN